jgi:galactokinase
LSGNAELTIVSMDQAASIFSRSHTALHTSFYPKIQTEWVEIPERQPEIVFLIAQSFVAADKHVTAPKCYNLRVVECTLAASVLAAKYGFERQKDHSPLHYSLRSFHESFYPGSADQSNQSFMAQLESLIEITKKILAEEEGYTREEIASILGISIEELELRYMTEFPIQAEKFMLRQRALHVFSEALRVLNFKKALSEATCEEKVKKLGNLMNQTQDSCRDVYDCSCPELDELCQIAREVGSIGSRLTGAGWGGCTVHLVLGDKVDNVTAAWKEKYYRTHFPTLSEEMLEEAIVISKPGTGAYVISPSAW